jgi:hypothetical protein
LRVISLRSLILAIWYRRRRPLLVASILLSSFVLLSYLSSWSFVEDLDDVGPRKYRFLSSCVSCRFRLCMYIRVRALVSLLALSLYLASLSCSLSAPPPSFVRFRLVLALQYIHLHHVVDTQACAEGLTCISISKL